MLLSRRRCYLQTIMAMTKQMSTSYSKLLKYCKWKAERIHQLHLLLTLYSSRGLGSVLTKFDCLVNEAELGDTSKYVSFRHVLLMFTAVILATASPKNELADEKRMHMLTMPSLIYYQIYPFCNATRRLKIQDSFEYCHYLPSSDPPE